MTRTYEQGKITSVDVEKNTSTNTIFTNAVMTKKGVEFRFAAEENTVDDGTRKITDYMAKTIIVPHSNANRAADIMWIKTMMKPDFFYVTFETESGKTRIAISDKKANAVISTCHTEETSYKASNKAPKTPYVPKMRKDVAPAPAG